MRNMSFMLTTQQIIEQRKWVTRRMGWKHLRAGELVGAVRKGMGLKAGEKVERLAVIRVLDAREESLGEMLRYGVYGWNECVLEGFPQMTPREFVRMFCESHRGCEPHSWVTRIEFEYVDTNG